MEQIVKYYKDEIESKESMKDKSYMDTSKDLFGFNGTDIILDKYEKIFQRFQTEKGKSNNIIESFDNLLTEIIPNQIMNQKKEVENGVVIYFKNVQIYKPYMYGESGTPTAGAKGDPIIGKKYKGLPNSTENIIPMYPIDAIMQQKTYEAEIRVDVYSKNTSGDNIFGDLLLYKDQPLGRIPIIKGCKYCWLRDMTDEEKISVGECFNDPLGYFIINGMEKAMIAKESVRVGKMLIAKWDKSSFNSIRMLSSTTKSTIMMKIGIDSKNNNSFEATINAKAFFISSISS
jgi:DNA-directed RNA polymerase beta subunit